MHGATIKIIHPVLRLTVDGARYLQPHIPMLSTGNINFM